MRLRKLGTFLLLATVLVGCETAQPGPSAEVRAQYNAAFQEMLKDPGNLEVVMAYAQAATKAGDYEGAVAAYEGMLIIDSNLPRVRLELGILYYRLKSYDVSRTYLETALQSPTLPADVRKPAEQLLAKMPKQSTTRPS
jgi:tetratricopeptide (TPR) repeat protein